MRPAVSRSVLLVLALLAAGCGRVDRVRECRALATRVNTGLDEIAARADAGAADPSTFHQIGDSYDRLAKDVAAYSKKDDAFGRVVLEYSAYLGETARACRTLATALEKKDAVTIARSRRDMAGQARRDKGFVARIEGICEGH